MKRWITVLLALALLTSTALASEWKDGRSPAKPYAGLPEVNLEETLGYIMFYPNSKMSYPHNCRALQVYLPRRDVVAGSGTLYLCSEENGEEARYAFNDGEHVNLRDMTADELDALLWDDGVCFEIRLDAPLKMQGAYFVNLEENCIVTEDGKIGNKTIGGTDSWAFETNAEYGFENLIYRRALESEGAEEEAEETEETEETEEAEQEYEILPEPEVGAELAFDLVLGGEAKMAALYCLNDSMEFETTMFTESGTVTGTILTETPAWGVVFLDEAGNALWSDEF